MSTAGSGPDREGRDVTPPSAPDEPRKRTAIFRWKGIIPLVLLLVLIGAVWVLFSDVFFRQTTEEVATKFLGTEVDLRAFHLHETEPSIDLAGIQVADPFNPRRNLVEAGALHIDLEPAPLLERKLVIRQFSLRNVRIGTARRTPARPVTGGGFAPAALTAIKQWAKQFDVPLLRLTPVDTIRSIVLNPTQLKTVQQALALKTQADSTQLALRQGFEGLALQQTLDSARALAQRLHGVRPLQLGVAGTKRAIDDVKRTIDQIN